MAVSGAAVFLGAAPKQQAAKEFRATVVLCGSRRRAEAFERVVDLIGKLDLPGQEVYLKGSYNSADPFPATTNPEMLRIVVQGLRDLGCRRIHLVERSGMGSTARIWRILGLKEALRGLDVHLAALDELAAGQWKKRQLPESHWKFGVEVPAFLEEGQCLVQLCNLKTHRFGGIFSASLKNTVGLVAKRGRIGEQQHNYMEELHSSPCQRGMIAELNQILRPSLIIMDATQVFVDGGPEKGLVAEPGLLLASSDRVALDVCGVSLLRSYGAGPALSRGGVFDQEQIRRAVELKLGVQSAEEMRLVGGDEDGHRAIAQINAALLEGVEKKEPG